MASKRMMMPLLGCLAAVIGLFAQGQAQSDLKVSSDPAGAQVTLEGEANVTGVTPVRFRQLLVGDYQLTLRKYGFETYRTRIILDPATPLDISFRLAPKTRFKATARSFFVPGWGQWYTDQKTKGLLLAALATGAAVFYFIADDEFDNKKGRFDRKLAEYDSVSVNGSVEQLRRLQVELDQVQDDAYDAENVRRVAIGSVIATWGINMLDALLLFPEERGTFSVKGLTIAPDVSQGTVGLTLSRKF